VRTRALVLSGGGFAGGAWMLGMIDGLRRLGIDLGDADLIVGTSAGARTGAGLATGGLERAVDLHRRGDLPELDLPATMEQFMEGVARAVAGVTDRREAARRVSNFKPLGERLVDVAERKRVTAAHVPASQWPSQRLQITAVDADSGERVVFDAGSGVPLHDALAATSALPGIFALPTIGGTRYVDGGVHSLYNADLASGHDVVVVLSPLAPNPYSAALLEAERAALGEGTAVHVILADETSLAAIGPDALSPQTAPAALEAGEAQARRELDALRSVWPVTASRVR
jgi:NTE family protein